MPWLSISPAKRTNLHLPLEAFKRGGGQYLHYGCLSSVQPEVSPPYLKRQVAPAVKDFPLCILECLLQPLLHRLGKLAGLNVVRLAYKLQH